MKLLYSDHCDIFYKEDKMRPFAAVMLATAFAPGCTHVALENNTVKQASTLTDLQYQQVLNNLAMFACNPDALASHLKITGGTVQVTDQGTGLFGTQFGGGVPATFMPSVSGQRGVVDQWNVVPAVDPDDLEPLQLAYQKALNPLDENGTIKKAICDQIAEMSVKYNIVLAKKTIAKIIELKVSPEKQMEYNDRSDKLYVALEKQFTDLAALSIPPTDVEKDIAKKRLQSRSGNPFDKILPPNPTEAEIENEANNEKIQKKIAIQQSRVGVEDQIVKLTADIAQLPYLARYPATGRPDLSPYTAAQVQDKIKSLTELIDDTSDGKFRSPWIYVGKKHDVPKCACYIGHYCSCNCDCYIWVMPEQRRILRDFTIAILNLAPVDAQQIPAPFPGGGVSFSPTANR